MTSGPIDDREEVLFRQIHPNFYDNNYPGSGQFAPSPKDENKLSVDRSTLTTPATSHRLFTGNGFQSSAVYSVTVGEFDSEGLPCHPDPLKAEGVQQANPTHAYADYLAFNVSQGKKIAKRLGNIAVKRGRLHPPDGP